MSENLRISFQIQRSVTEESKLFACLGYLELAKDGLCWLEMAWNGLIWLSEMAGDSLRCLKDGLSGLAMA